ncbi:twin arginine translocase protein A [Rhodanobacter fulvus Jip2]|jgi:sec-independent protein translocase protein TatA|uniref:Sec-independent protein translocase protein TatA n=1 Tax=Rhodanobacter fulvus Jip2 TaxID=1163408 RepID=I4VZC2_9GAMM|nr:twin-arginine translocase TatA/TatE family subunit [Rhodanobacter fulvus]EIL92563.1 twin arginine translocase protein A [Rhodanobacter fulvus Jip2]
MLGLNSFSHWIVLLVLVLLLFGTGKLRNTGRDLGGAIAGFRKGLKSDTSDDAAEQATSSNDPR